MKPILMNGESVRGILDCRKTQTRRVIKPQPIRVNDAFDGTWDWKGHLYDDLTLAMTLKDNCPYGQVGDRLWVRETFCIACDEAVAATTGDDISHNKPCFRADPANQPAQDFCEFPHWKPSIHMPRWASRITLEITGVEVEKIQDITNEDAEAEGALCHWQDGDTQWPAAVALTKPTMEGPMSIGSTYRLGFQILWDSINAKRGYGWDINPRDFALTFKVVK